MIKFNKINNITGWLLFVIAAVVYTLTVEPTASFWDCGEFIAVSYKLEVPHPPGAPLFLLLGRMFSFLAGGDTSRVAFWINMLSVTSAALTIMFLYWTIVLLGRKLIKVKVGEETQKSAILLVGAGVIGALAYTFSDSFWFSAVEAEVYAMSSFFTAVVFWAILKWELIEDKQVALKWLILIAYLIGLSIGVHLLNLVTIPALGLIIYYKYYDKPTFKGVIVALLLSVGMIFLIHNGIIPGLPSLAFAFEIFFVNTIGLPFGTGLVFFILLFIGGLVFGIIYTIKKKMVLLNTLLLSLSFILIGYSAYSLVLIRSGYNPPIDENNPEGLVEFISYLKREQYGSRPLVYGPYFTAKVVSQEEGVPVYIKGEEEYEIIDHKIVTTHDPKHSGFLPRAYSSQPNHVKLYRQMMNLKRGEKPSMFDDFGFMFSHQIGHMYLRYFMWNFAGRAGDVQGDGVLTPFDSKDELPELMRKNRAYNQYYWLPLILGLIGLFFQYSRSERSFLVTFLLFLLTGVGLVFYLNSPPVEPRERDYIYVGSYYAFAIWIGFGVIALAKMLEIWLDEKIAASVAFVACLIVPSIMMAEGWDDHDRSNRYFSVDSAKNFLNSCEENAILFTGGDNDTFPLWYVQEVEGFRTDVRVIVLSYFNTDWYIEQMTRQAYESEPINFSLNKSHYRQGGKNDYLPLRGNIIEGGVDANVFLNLVRDNDPRIQLGGIYNRAIAKQYHIPVDTAKVKNMGIIPDDLESLLTDRVTLRLKTGAIEKKDLMILDLIANNNWERPIYFNNTSLNGISFDIKEHVVQEGACYRLLPLKAKSEHVQMVNTDLMYENLFENFAYRSLNDSTVNHNTYYRQFASNHRAYFADLAEAYVRKGELGKAKETVYKCLEIMPDNCFPYSVTMLQLATTLLQVGDNEKALEILFVMADRAVEELEYYKEEIYRIDERTLMIDVHVLGNAANMLQKLRHEKTSTYSEMYSKYASIYNKRLRQR